MTTAEEYLKIANEAYAVDPLWHGLPPLRMGSKFTAGSGEHQQLYQVIDSENDPVSGFQAMAVVPVVNGKPDMSHITVSYAGTNPDHRADLLSDVESVVGGQQGSGSQVFDAKMFAARVRDQYPGATFTTAGHSLGAFLALLIAAENGWSATTFNGPDPWESLSPQAKEWLRNELAAGRNPLHNYVNERDLIGNLYPNKTGSADYVTDRAGRSIFGYHNIGKGGGFEVNPDGTIKGAGAKGRSLEEIIENAVHLPGLAQALGPGLTGLVATLRNPEFTKRAGNSIAGLIVTVNTVSALGLAASIAGTQVALAEIKQANARLVPRMEEGLLAAMNAAALLPYITTLDIENCVHQNRLHVHQRIDENAVAEVDRLVDKHISRVNEISDGISNAVLHTFAQDAQWALAFATQ
ncbi:hypothetical protein [Leifsonia sp. 2MCAF36]|uniref:hypothetical protein n=1 Tax=Leifsonia sp. 2MCAF36 TaxID=3232988 RepID=UPI003F96349C